nr:putative ribonuclease H-like domain-containing protein [Tanacetum cinerariifolium]
MGYEKPSTKLTFYKAFFSSQWKNIVPFGDLTCLFAKETLDESNLWHKRLSDVNFKTINKLVKGNLVRGLPTKFCGLKGIKREFSVPRTPQQNGIVERKNRTLIEAARTLLVDSLLPIPFWAEAVNTTCYVQNRVLVTKPHNKTPYELLHGRLPSIGFMRPFDCPVTILNTLDPLGKFQGKVDEGFLVGYYVCSKAFRVFNSRTRIVQETLHVNFMENKPTVAGSGPAWLFDIDSLTRTMNYHPVIAENQTNSHTDLQDTKKAGAKGTHTYVLFPVLFDGSTNSQNNNKDALVDGKENDDDIQKSVSPDIHSSSSGAQTRKQGDKTENKDKGKSPVVTITRFRDLNAALEECTNNSSNRVNAASSSVSTAGHNFINSTNDFSAAGPSNAAASPTAANSLNMPNLEDLTHSNDADDVGVEADITNLESIISVIPIPTTRIHKDHPISQIIGDLSSTTQTRSMARTVYINKKDERGIVIGNKARLVAQGHTQEEGIDYQEVFAPVSRIEAIRMFLAYASFMGFLLYQMDVKSAFLYGTIEEEVYVYQPPGFEDPKNPDKVYEVVKALYGLHQAPRAWYETLATYLLENGFKRGTIDQTLFIKKQQKDILLVKQKKDGIFINQDKYVAKILKKFRLSEGKSASTLIDAEKPLLKDSDGCSLRNMVMEIVVLHILSDVLPITTNDDVTRLQALVDRKKIVISEAVIREILQLDDAEGVVCLPNEEICAGLAQMGYKKPSTKLTFYKAFFSSQWKFLIHTLLQSLSTKRTSWNEFSTAMASAVICLSKGQKFNFSKYIFDSLVRNVDSSSKFYMYPRFIQLIIQNQVGDLSTHTIRYISPALTQKVFANMRRVRKGFSRVETPLFEEDVANDAIPSPPSHDIPSPSQEQSSPPQQPQSSPQAPPQGADFPTHIQQILDVCSALTRHVENLENDKSAQKLEIIKLKARVKRLEKANKVKSSKLRRLRKVGASKRVESFDDMEDAEIYNFDLDHSSKVLSMQEDDSEVQEVVDVVTTAKLITNVVITASQVSAAIATISAAKPSIPAAPTVVDAYTKRRKGVIIRDPEEELSSKTPVETPKLKDKGKGILVETPNPMKKKDQIELDAEYARKLHEEINQDHEEINKDIDWDAAIDHTESEARKTMMIYLKNTASYKMDFFKGMSYAKICPIFQARFDENMRFLFKSREEMEEEDQEIIKSINETPAQKAAKRRKLSEEAKDLRKRLKVVDDEDDDVFIEATPLARKVPVVDYQIVLIDNKPRFKIIKADETHQFYISFTTLLKNFDREDLENL